MTQTMTASAARKASKKTQHVRSTGDWITLIVLIAACIIGMVYTGGFFEGESFISAFSGSDASVGLVIGGFIALLFTFVYYMLRDVITFHEFAECVPEGFHQS